MKKREKFSLLFIIFVRIISMIIMQKFTNHCPLNALQTILLWLEIIEFVVVIKFKIFITTEQQCLQIFWRNRPFFLLVVETALVVDACVR